MEGDYIMKKFVLILSILLFISFNINKTTVMAAHEPISLKQGIYSFKDTKLLENTLYSVQNISLDNSAIIFIINNKDLMLLEFIHLEPKAQKSCFRPLKNSYSIIIFGNAEIVFS